MCLSTVTSVTPRWTRGDRLEEGIERKKWKEADLMRQTLSFIWKSGLVLRKKKIQSAVDVTASCRENANMLPV